MNSAVLARTRAFSVADGMLHAVMLGVTENYLAAFAVELGHQDLALALLTTVPLVLGALAQLAAGPITAWVGGRRRVIVLGAALQALSQLGFMAIAVTGDTRLWTLLAVRTVFWTSGALIAPVWNAWILAFTRPSQRERWFAWRSGAINLALVSAYLGAGFFLDHHRHLGALLRGFAILYAVGIVARLLSTACLRLHADLPSAVDPPGAPTRTRRRLRLALSDGEWRVALIIASVMFGAYFAVPFFTPYMLRELGLDFDTYALLTSVSVLVKTVAFPLYGPIAARVGLRRVMVASGLVIIALPFGWAVVPSVAGLMVVEVFAGAAWAGFEFATFQLLIQASPPSCKVEFFSLAASLTGFAQLAGSLCGSVVLSTFGLRYTDIFLISAVLRGLALLTLLTPLGRRFASWPLRQIWVRLPASRVNAGLERRPVMADDGDEGDEGDGTDGDGPTPPAPTP